ncbi:MAG TPA: hypothetical protein VI818_01165, partial [Candidatus Thermoplasmatota archaeon]|nr:hypothetical protein [Candidatus Thermoplasmatota archaeon]
MAFRLSEIEAYWVMGTGSFLATAFASVVILSGCAAPAPPALSEHPEPTLGASKFFVPGRVVLGAVDEARVRAYVLEADGSRGDLVGTGTTNGTGAFTLGFPAQPPASMLVESRGGRFTDAASGASGILPTDVPLTAVLDGNGTPAWVSVTGFTHMAASRARTLAADGTPLYVAVASSNAGVQSQYLLEDVIVLDPEAALDAPGRYASLNERAYRGVIGGLSLAAQDLATTPFVLAQALARDATDGRLDGQYKDGAVRLALTQSATVAEANAWSFQGAQAPPTLQPTAGTQMLANAIELYAGKIGPGQPSFPIATDPLAIGASSAAALYGGTSVLPAFSVGEASTFTLSALGGSGQYGCGLLSAAPEGFTVSGACVLAGQPPGLAPGTSKKITPPFVVRIQDVAAPNSHQD